MKAKHSAVLLSGLLLFGLFAAVSQTSDTKPPACPALADTSLQSMLLPTAWVRANWNANTKQWDIQCSEMDSLANMPASLPTNSANTAPRKRHPNE
jgi:hypothetical protein